MTVIAVRAEIECDGCRTHFSVDIDPAREFEQVGWSIFDEAIDAIRGNGGTSVQSDLMLCCDCTKIVDDAIPEDVTATRERVESALKQKFDI